jgi:hypothetical protein
MKFSWKVQVGGCFVDVLDEKGEQEFASYIE